MCHCHCHYPPHDSIRKNKQRKYNQHQSRPETRDRKIKEEDERKTKIPQDILYIVNEGKAPSEKQTIVDCNVRGEPTIKVSLKLKGVTKDEEMTTSAGSTDEGQVRRRTSESHSEISGIEDMKLGDVTDLLQGEIECAPKTSNEGEIETASRRSEERMEQKHFMRSTMELHAITMEHMDMMVIGSNELL